MVKPIHKPLIVLALLLVGSGGGAAQAALPTEPSQLTAAPATAAVEATTVQTASQASARMPAGYRRFVSLTNGYSIGYPQRWSVERDFVKIGTVGADEFVKRDAGVELGVIAVDRTAIAGGTTMTPKELLNAGLARATQVPGLTLTRLTKTTIKGELAYVTEWVQERHAGQPSRLTAKSWVARGKVWNVVLSTPVGKHDRYRPVLNTMVRTLRYR